MSKENKELLLKDLSARLPYRVMCEINNHYYELVDVDIKRELVYLLKDGYYTPWSILRGDVVKPYLRPLSSMTDEEKKEYKHLVAFGGSPYGASDFIDWLNAHHFDYHTGKGKDGKRKTMIELGLAIEVTKDNNPYE